MDALLNVVLSVFIVGLKPIEPLKSLLGVSISKIDGLAVLRLGLVMRQVREAMHAEFLAKQSKLPKASRTETESYSLVKSAAATLTVVYGGEVIVAVLLGNPPTFLFSPVFPVAFVVAQAFFDALPTVPTMSLYTELPLSIVDGFTRSMLLCNAIPLAVISNPSPLIAQNPWTLLVISLFMANGGFFFVNLFSFLNPHPMSLTTPAELKPYGWTTVDLWCAPFVTGLFALLTHAQPAWANLHVMLAQVLSGARKPVLRSQIAPATDDLARAVCVVVLCSLFITRTLVNFGPAALKRKSGPSYKASHTLSKTARARQSLTPTLSEKDELQASFSPAGFRSRNTRSASVKLKSQ